jgi:hypothetical protein
MTKRSTVKRREFLAAAAATMGATTLPANDAQPAKRQLRPASGFDFDDGKLYTMPAHFGARPRANSVYERVTSLSTAYTTDKDAAVALLPPGYRITDPAVVTVTFSECHGYELLAGGNYYLVMVNLSAVFEEEHGDIRGAYALVLKLATQDLDLISGLTASAGTPGIGRQPPAPRLLHTPSRAGGRAG